MKSSRGWIRFPKKFDEYEAVQNEPSCSKSLEPQIHDPLLRTRSKKRRNRIMAAVLITLVLVIFITVICTSKLVKAPANNSTSSDTASYESCVMTLDESMPENMTFPDGTPGHMTVYETWSSLISMATRSLDIASHYIGLGVVPSQFPPISRIVGRRVLDELVKAGKERGVKIRILISWNLDPSMTADFGVLKNEAHAELRMLNVTKLFGSGVQHSKMMIVDGKHVNTGSANLDWIALTQNKEIGITLYNCSSIAYDMEKVFETYWSMAVENPVFPQDWPISLQTSINLENPLPLRINDSLVFTYISNSPAPFCPKGRTTDLQSTLDIIERAQKFIYVSLLAYMPQSQYRTKNTYWAVIEDTLKRAITIRGIRVRVIGFNRSSIVPESLWYLNSLNALRSHEFNIEVKVFNIPFYNEALAEFPHMRLKHDRYIVTDNAAYISTSDWIEDYFVATTGVSIVFRDAVVDGTATRNVVRENLLQLFTADWNSKYSDPI